MNPGGNYLAIDVGATKTLLAVFSEDGKVLHEQKIATDKKYDRFLDDLEATLQQEEFKNYQIAACCCAIPGKVDRKTGIGITFGNLAWKNVAVKADLEKILGNIPIYVENDANLAGLYEAHNHKEYKKVLYLTVSTGIGDGIIIDGKIDPDFADSEPGLMVLEHEGKLQKWEDFASGRAFKAKYDKKVAEVDNPFIWRQYSRVLAQGMDALAAVIQPDVIIIGGGVGAHLEKFADILEEELKKMQNNMVQIPPIIKADKAEEAVIYGCYEYIRQST
ncbi:MAG TPA: ROK family protein [Candidatus Saccharimonadales bacterium]|nr:ROK family protein [Candidatus Saccharimonadales bacterium]